MTAPTDTVRVRLSDRVHLDYEDIDLRGTLDYEVASGIGGLLVSPLATVGGYEERGGRNVVAYDVPRWAAEWLRADAADRAEHYRDYGDPEHRGLGRAYAALAAQIAKTLSPEEDR